MPQTTTSNFWGLGDMLRGIVTSHMVCKKLGYSFFIDARNHPIQHFLKETNHPFVDNVNQKRNTIRFEAVGDLKQLGDVIQFSRNDAPFLFATNGTIIPFYENAAIEFIRGFLTPSATLLERIHFMKPKHSYTIFHVRCGDSFLVRGETGHFKSLYERFLAHKAETDILISDSCLFKQYVKENCPCTMFNHSVCHVGVSSDLESIGNTMLEFFIASGAQAIKTVSVYSWTSGFVDSIHKIYQVPLINL